MSRRLCLLLGDRMLERLQDIITAHPFLFAIGFFAVVLVLGKIAQVVGDHV